MRDTHLKVKARNGRDASAAKGQDFLAIGQIEYKEAGGG